jgi:CubicO group peptidase (beta-lactamase class C family)
MNDVWAKATPESVGLSSTGIAKIDAMLEELIATGELPGASILIARHGKLIHRSILGLKNIATGEPLAEDTIFAIFSMTKPVTAVAMMLLFEEGRWSPDDPIAKHLPEFAEVRMLGGGAPDHAPTMGELMTHTAGLGYGIGLGPHDAVDQAYIDAGVWQAENLAEMSRRVAAAPLAYQPGGAWRYSIAMDVQGAIIERLTGQSLPDFMRSRIFAPLGMADTDFYVPAPKQPRRATLYHMYGVPKLTVLDHPGFARDGVAIPKIPSGGGGLFSTVKDYGRFAQMLLNKGELGGSRILEPDSVAMMIANHLPRPILEREVDAGFQHIRLGFGYGYNGAACDDPALAKADVGKGTYQWDGASGVWFWVDPENDLIFVGMIQRMLQDGMPRLQALTQRMVKEAMA